MASTTINRKNLARQILAGRAIAKLTRVELAKLASMAHPTVKLAEDGDSTVSEEALGKICRALENLGFEFLDGTNTPSLAFHEQNEIESAGITADASMPGWVRRIYPRRLDARSLFNDLEACGVQVDNVNVLLDLCATSEGSWMDTIGELASKGRKYGIHFQWRDVVNTEGLRHALRIYSLPPATLNALEQNITKPGDALELSGNVANQ
ncbi:hypothetical protein BVZ28_13935 [Alcaligenes faecalis]|uniref:Uncharacterized protein n=1 Tax=Alcaligenes faecalis TaxID=511 RepID=A0A1Z3MKV7_ALCFA|nr:helix-turn-helix domain-containing protein [Alcaligenes faecalis]ASD48442.1 hypothetical protein [Alcaligenes faecalis]OSZ33105.1 hypothetical protein BVZ28_13935 [Alcaligenes faecalis]OSZ41185.1 hypothetical protein BVZ29_13510 [Alcaligenes faecalis]